MKVAGNQPYFMPYIGYWQLINAVDTFCIGDDYNFINKGWINRNRILGNSGIQYVRIDLEKASSNKLISEIELVEIPIDQKIRQLTSCYGKAPYFNVVMKLMEQVYRNKEKNLAGFLADSLYQVCEYLDIKTNICLSSSFDQIRRNLKRENRIYDSCHQLGADIYYNPFRGQELYSYQEFTKEGIQLAFLKREVVEYSQKNVTSFIGDLSIIDVMMNNSKEKVKEMLGKYELITNKETIT